MGNYWTAFDWGKYEKKTDHLSVTQHGAYFLLLKYYYKTRRALPANADVLLRVCRAFAEPEKQAVLAVLDEFFILGEDGYHNPTADEELEKQAQLSEKRSLAGKKGVESKAANANANASANGEQLHTQLQSQLHSSGEVIFKTSVKEKGQFVLPGWIPETTWAEYEQMRRRIRKPMTDRARLLAVNQLAELRNKGHTPEAVLNQSIFNSWQGLFEPKGNGNGNRQTRNAADERAERIIERARRISALGQSSGGTSDGAAAGDDRTGATVLDGDTGTLLPE